MDADTFALIVDVGMSGIAALISGLGGALVYGMKVSLDATRQQAAATREGEIDAVTNRIEAVVQQTTRTALAEVEAAHVGKVKGTMWDQKRELYTDMLWHLHRMAFGWLEIWRIDFERALGDGQARQSRVDALLADINEHSEKLKRTLAVMPVVLDQAAFDTMSGFVTRSERAHSAESWFEVVDAQSAIMQEAYWAMVAAARADLGLPPLAAKGELVKPPPSADGEGGDTTM